MGMTLLRVGELIGRSRAPVARFQSEFSAWFFGRQDKERKCGGQRRAYLTFEDEKEFWSGFFEDASRCGILVVRAIRTALEKKLGHKVVETTVYRMLARHGWRKILPRRRHSKANEAAQKGFKKTRNSSSQREQTASEKEKESLANVSRRAPLWKNQWPSKLLGSAGSATIGSLIWFESTGNANCLHNTTKNR
jgi:transposase